MKIDIGISQKARKEISEGLSNFLAETYTLYLKTQNFHWNMTGPNFIGLHLLLQKHYEDMAEATDEIAERIRSLGFFAEGSFSAFKKRAKIPEENQVIEWKEMVRRLVKGHELISKYGVPFVRRAQDLGDDGTADMIIRRLQFHQKAAWILRSHLGKF